MTKHVDGEKVKELREAKLLERRELAALAGVSYSTLYKMEAHGHVPRLSTVRALAKVLKVSPSEILANREDLVAS